MKPWLCRRADSDGVLNHFISAREAVDFDPILPLHELRGYEPYHLAMFLTGAHNPHGLPCNCKSWGSLLLLLLQENCFGQTRQLGHCRCVQKSLEERS